jgi:pyruvate ferredoxin oxidoreductase delta subunit
VTYCPESTVLLTEEKKIIFDYRYCKGCGVCANECPVNAIAMVKEGSQ